MYLDNASTTPLTQEVKDYISIRYISESIFYVSVRCKCKTDYIYC